MVWTSSEPPLSIQELAHTPTYSTHIHRPPAITARPITIGNRHRSKDYPKSRASGSEPVRRTRHALHCIAVISRQQASLTADPYGLALVHTCRDLILWHHYRRPRSRKRPTVASKHLQDLPSFLHPGTSGHTSSRSRVSPAESLASLLQSPSSGQRRRLCCQRLQGRPLVWHISQSQTFRGSRNGTAQQPSHAISRAIRRDTAISGCARVRNHFPYSFFLLLIIIVVVSSPLRCTAQSLLLKPRNHLPPAKVDTSTVLQLSLTLTLPRPRNAIPTTSTRLSITPILSLLHIRTEPAHPWRPPPPSDCSPLVCPLAATQPTIITDQIGIPSRTPQRTTGLPQILDPAAFPHALKRTLWVCERANQQQCSPHPLAYKNSPSPLCTLSPTSCTTNGGSLATGLPTPLPQT